MKHIVTITLNPAIDKSTVVDEMKPEKKLKCNNPKFEPGGGGVNISRVLQRLNNKATTIYFEGGYSGKFFTQLIKIEKIEKIAIEIKNNTRENFIVFDQKNNLQYRFGMPGPKIHDKEALILMKTIEQLENVDYLIVSGSMPIGIDDDFIQKIAKIAQNKKAKFIVDTSGDSLKKCLKENVFLIKPNLNELAYIAGLNEISIQEIPKVTKQIIARGKCEAICVSLGAKGAMLITKENAYNIVPPKVNAMSTVGAGDSMLAGIVHKLSMGEDLLSAAKYGVSCGTAATLNPGTELCHLTDAEIIYKQITVDSEVI